MFSNYTRPEIKIPVTLDMHINSIKYFLRIANKLIFLKILYALANVHIHHTMCKWHALKVLSFVNLFITGYNQSVTRCGSQRNGVVVTQRKLMVTTI